MIAVTGITGKIGSQLARTLLAEHKPVRAVVRDIRKGRPWELQGCEVAQADINDSAALAAAFQGQKPSSFLSAQLRPASRLSRGSRHCRGAEIRAHCITSRQGCIPLDYWHPSRPIQPAHLTHHHREGPGPTARPHHLSAPSLVYGERRMGCCISPRLGHHSQLSPTPRQARPHGRHCGHRSGRRRASSGRMGWPPSR